MTTYKHIISIIPLPYREGLGEGPNNQVTLPINMFSQRPNQILESNNKKSFSYICTSFVLACTFISSTLFSASAAPSQLTVNQRIAQLEKQFNTRLNPWQAHTGDIPHAEAIDFDDTHWQSADIGFKWEKPYSFCWFRRWIEVPEKLAGVPTAGKPLALRVTVDNGGTIYVNGQMKQTNFDRAAGYAVITESAQPGERYPIAIRGINRPGWGALLDARLETPASAEIQPSISALLEKLKFASSLQVDQAHDAPWITALDNILNEIDLRSLEQNRISAFLESLVHAEVHFGVQALPVLRKTAASKLSQITEKTKALADILKKADSAQLDLSYQRITQTVATNFQAFASEDINSSDIRIITRGLWNLDWINNALTKAIRQADQLLNNPSLSKPVPRYVTGPVEIRDGAFWQQDYPLQFVGMGHFGQVKKDIPIFPDYGFNIAQITVSVGSILTDENQINTAPIDELLQVLDRAAANNVAVDLLIEPHGWPAWANRKYPEISSDNPGFLKCKVDHPQAKIILEKYLDTLIPRIANHPALFSYCLFNEPSYIDTSEYSHQQFQRWLANHHHDIQSLNKLYATDYQSFDEVRLPKGIVSVDSRGEKPTLEADQALATYSPDLYDWYRFNQDRFATAHEWMIEKIRRLDPHTPFHSKVMGKMFDTHLDFTIGIDHARWCAATDISGNDNWSYYRSWTDHDPVLAGRYASNWWRQAMYYDFQRSIAPTHPLFNSENHPIEDNTPIWVAERHIRTVYWQGAIHGQGATTTWVWQHGSDSLGDSIITRANCTHTLGTTGLDLLRLGPELHQLQQIAPEVALLVVPASIPFSEDYLNSMKATYEGLNFLGIPIGFATQQQAEQGKLDQYKAIYVPAAVRVPDELVQHLSSYVKSGGTLVVVGNSFAQNEYGQPRTSPTFMPNVVDPKIPTHSTFGKGTTYYRPALADLSTRKAFANSLINDLKVTRPILLTEEHGIPTTGIEYRSTPYRDGYLLNLVNYRRHELPVRINTPHPAKKITNLFTNKPTDQFLELEPLQPLLLYIE